MTAMEEEEVSTDSTMAVVVVHDGGPEVGPAPTAGNNRASGGIGEGHTRIGEVSGVCEGARGVERLLTEADQPSLMKGNGSGGGRGVRARGHACRPSRLDCNCRVRGRNCGQNLHTCSWSSGSERRAEPDGRRRSMGREGHSAPMSSRAAGDSGIG